MHEVITQALFRTSCKHSFFLLMLGLTQLLKRFCLRLAIEVKSLATLRNKTRLPPPIFAFEERSFSIFTVFFVICHSNLLVLAHVEPATFATRREKCAPNAQT